LKVRGAVAKSGTTVAKVTRLTIIKDPAASIYMNFNVLQDKTSHIVTLVELSQRHNMIAPLIFPDVKVLAYGPTFVDVGADFLSPDTKYAVLVTYRSMHLPKCREFLNSVNLIHKPDDKMSNMVRSFVNYIPGPQIEIPLCPSQFKFLGMKYSFTYKQAPPGAGKTHALVQDAKLVYDDYRFDCFIIAPTNEVVLEICDRLCSLSVPHNVALSHEGLLKRLNSRYSLSTNFTLRKQQMELLRSSPVQFTMSLKAHSNIYVMTVNKSLTPKYDTNGIVPTIIFWDEITLSSTCTFFSVLNKNPQIMITYGDEKQGTPYEVGVHKDENKVLYSPINVFRIPGSPYHNFLRRHVRMRGLAGDLFLRHFYDTSFDLTFHSFFPSTTSFEFLTHHSFVSARHPTPADKLGATLNKSYLTNVTKFNQFVHAPGGDWLTIVPYLAEKARLDKASLISKNHPRILTFRPAQGQQSRNVFIHFVKPRFSKFLTNTSCLVALSRFVEKLIICFVPDLPKSFKDLVTGYVYRDSFSVGVNYTSFVQLCVTNFNNKYKVADPKFGRDSLLDHNGDFFLKWWFYLALLERISLMANKLPYCYEMTAFANCIPGNKFDIKKNYNLYYRVNFDSVGTTSIGLPQAPYHPDRTYLTYKIYDKNYDRISTSYRDNNTGAHHQYFEDGFVLSHFNKEDKFTPVLQKLNQSVPIFENPSLFAELKQLIAVHAAPNSLPVNLPEFKLREYYCYQQRGNDGELLTIYRDHGLQKIVKYYDRQKP
jgi:hypothetical protein